MSERVFLDANILVSAAWRADSRLLVLWNLPDTQLLTSAYVIVEAERNVVSAEQRTRLYRLVQPPTLPAKDVPILLAAIDAGATYLLTGDKDHFGKYYDRLIEGVTILRPARYLAPRAD